MRLSMAEDAPLRCQGRLLNFFGLGVALASKADDRDVYSQGLAHRTRDLGNVLSVCRLSLLTAEAPRYLC